MKKKILSVILSSALLASMLPVNTAFADEVEVKIGGYRGSRRGGF